MRPTTSSLLALLLASSASTLPMLSSHQLGLTSTPSSSIKPCSRKPDALEESTSSSPRCTTVKAPGPRGGYVFTCPGCTKIVGPDGNGKIVTGDRCGEYKDLDMAPLGDAAFEGPQCTTVKSPYGGVVFHCPGCTIVLDQNGNELVRTGDRCDEYDTPDGEEFLLGFEL